MSSDIKSVIRLTPSIRRKASANVWNRKDEAFDMDFLYTSLNQLVDASTNRTVPLFRQLRQIDLTRVLKESPGLNRFFTCSFFTKRFAWISKNEQGEYRYFSKIQEGHGYYSFDLFDILTILFNKTSKELIQHLEVSYPFHSVSEWGEGERKKYDENLSMIRPLVLCETPSLQRVLKGGLDVLEAFLSFGKEKVNGKHLSDGVHSVFFLSVQYFKERFFPKKSISTLNQWMNLFAVLGLIEKTVNVPIELQTEAEKQQALKKKYNHVSFYIIPSFTHIFPQAETRAKELVTHRLSYHQLTKKVVLSIFGKAVHDHVYVQKTHGRKQKETNTEERLSLNWLETLFEMKLNERGFVVKKELEKQSALGKTVFQRVWNRLLVEHECTTTVPTSEERERYGLKHRQSLARREMAHSVESTVWRDEDRLPWESIEDIRAAS